VDNPLTQAFHRRQISNGFIELAAYPFRGEFHSARLVHRSGYRARPDRHHHALRLAEALRSTEWLDREFGPAKTLTINVAAKQAGDVAFMRSFAEILRASPLALRIMRREEPVSDPGHADVARARSPISRPTRSRSTARS
jgi:hypothetical protein